MFPAVLPHLLPKLQQHELLLNLRVYHFNVHVCYEWHFQLSQDSLYLWATANSLKW